MRYKHEWLIILIFMTSQFAYSADRVSVADLPKYAIEHSQITLPGSRPFHLKATVAEATNPDNDNYSAEIEEYWFAPDKWTRTVKALDFSQTTVVSGNKISEQMSGDYSPRWLRTMVEAIFDPGAHLQGLDLSKSSDNPMIGGTMYCRRFAFRAGIPPIGNDVFSTFCFEENRLMSVGIPGYEAEYSNYRKFGDKQVARKIKEFVESGTELEATISELTELGTPDESLFAIQESKPILQTVVVSEETVRGLLQDSPAIQWPLIQGGKSKGVLTIYVCIDRDGRVRETYGLNSDHPIMTDAARNQIMKWRFKQATSKGLPVQVESMVTFAYETRIAPASEGGL